MGYEKNNPKGRKYEIKARNRYRPAYTPSPPFRTIEGIESDEEQARICLSDFREKISSMSEPKVSLMGLKRSGNHQE